MPKTAFSNHLVDQFGINGCTIEVMNNETKAAKDVHDSWYMDDYLIQYIMWMVIGYKKW